MEGVLVNILFLLFFQSGPTQVAGLNGTTEAFQVQAHQEAQRIGLVQSGGSTARAIGRR